MKRFVSLLQKWNRVYNLTASNSTESINDHIADSLSIASYLKGPKILDVGSGAGFPGIPLALTLPQFSFTLLDSQIKKTRFLNQVKIELDIKNIEIVKQRIEAFHPNSSFDSIVTRATFSINDFIEKTMRLLNPKGRLLMMKGKYPMDELADVNKIGIKIDVHKLSALEFAKERHLVIIEFAYEDHSHH